MCRSILPPNERVSILGPSGCGNSTFSLMAVGVVDKSAGQNFDQRVPVSDSLPDIGVVFQQPVLLLRCTVIYNVLCREHSELSVIAAGGRAAPAKAAGRSRRGFRLQSYSS